MKVIEIISTWLKANGCDGLYTDNCGCKIDDLAPCGFSPWDCEAGVLAQGDPDGGKDWSIGPRHDTDAPPLSMCLCGNAPGQLPVRPK